MEISPQWFKLVKNLVSYKFLKTFARSLRENKNFVGFLQLNDILDKNTIIYGI
jgi:hypothetical protein